MNDYVFSLARVRHLLSLWCPDVSVVFGRQYGGVVVLRLRNWCSLNGRLHDVADACRAYVSSDYDASDGSMVVVLSCVEYNGEEVAL